MDKVERTTNEVIYQFTMKQFMEKLGIDESPYVVMINFTDRVVNVFVSRKENESKET